MQSQIKAENSGMEMQAADSTSQYLTFFMAGEEYGVDILCVQEIRGWENATPLPNAPVHIKGVINLRGTIVPIIDLRQCFGMAGIENTPVTVVIVLKVKSNNGSRIVGIVVDAVSDVYSLGHGDMRPVPDLGEAVDIHFIKALVTVNNRMVILLNIDELLVVEELPDLKDLKTKVSGL